jgi:hypothetical protein
MIEKIATIFTVSLLTLVIVIGVGAAKEGCASEIAYTESSFGQVECCCVTITGGTCCGLVTFCSSFIPGCMCSL